MDLSGKVAVVTGGAAGIGRHVSLGFARAGADVAVAALETEATRTVCDEIEAMGRTAAGWPLDLNAFDELEGIRDGVLEKFGRVDILATVAGVPGNWWLIHETPEEDWDEVMNINLKGMYLTCKAFIPTMIEQGAGGAIITFTSSLGQRVHPKRGIYAISKWGIIALTKTMAIELAADRIRVNTVAPGGGVAGERRDRWFEQAAAQLGTTAEAQRAAMVDAIPMHELIEPDEIARLCVFLASDDSRKITGEVLNINGGHGLAVLDATLPPPSSSSLRSAVHPPLPEAERGHLARVGDGGPSARRGLEARAPGKPRVGLAKRRPTSRATRRRRSRKCRITLRQSHLWRYRNPTCGAIALRARRGCAAPMPTGLSRSCSRARRSRRSR